MMYRRNHSYLKSTTSGSILFCQRSCQPYIVLFQMHIPIPKRQHVGISIFVSQYLRFQKPVQQSESDLHLWPTTAQLATLSSLNPTTVSEASAGSICVTNCARNNGCGDCVSFWTSSIKQKQNRRRTARSSQNSRCLVGWQP